MAGNNNIGFEYPIGSRIKYFREQKGITTKSFKIWLVSAKAI